MTNECAETQEEASIKADIEELSRVVKESMHERDLCGRIMDQTLPICSEHQRAQSRLTELNMIEFKARLALSNAWATLRKVQGRTFPELCARYAKAPEA